MIIYPGCCGNYSGKYLGCVQENLAIPLHERCILMKDYVQIPFVSLNVDATPVDATSRQRGKKPRQMTGDQRSSDAYTATPTRPKAPKRYGSVPTSAENKPRDNAHNHNSP